MDYKGDTAAATTACIKRARYSVAQHENEQQLIYCMTTKNNDYNVYSVWSNDQSVRTNTAKADKIGHEASAAYIVQLAVQRCNKNDTSNTIHHLI